MIGGPAICRAVSLARGKPKTTARGRFRAIGDSRLESDRVGSAKNGVEPPSHALDRHEKVPILFDSHRRTRYGPPSLPKANRRHADEGSDLPNPTSRVSRCRWRQARLFDKCMIERQLLDRFTPPACSGATDAVITSKNRDRIKHDLNSIV